MVIIINWSIERTVLSRKPINKAFNSLRNVAAIIVRVDSSGPAELLDGFAARLEALDEQRLARA